MDQEPKALHQFPQGDAIQAQPPDLEPPRNDYEALRRKGVQHEYNIRAVGLYYYITTGMVGVFLLLRVAMNQYVFGGGLFSLDLEILPWIIMILGAVLLGGILGYGVRNVRRWVWVPVIIVTAISMVKMNHMTLIGAAILWLLCSRQGRLVFSRPYQEAIPMTPHIKGKSRDGWVVGFIVLLFAVLLLLHFFARDPHAPY